MGAEDKDSFSAKSYTDVKNDFAAESELETEVKQGQFGSLDTSVRQFMDSTNVKNQLADVTKQDARAKQQYRESPAISNVPRRRRPPRQQSGPGLNPVLLTLIVMTVLLVLTVLYKQIL